MRSNNCIIDNLHGWLYKEKQDHEKKIVSSLLFGKYIHRYFTVEYIRGVNDETSTERALCYYKNESTREPSGWLFLADVLSVKEEGSVIVIVHPSRTFTLRADTTYDHNRWLAGLVSLCSKSQKSLDDDDNSPIIRSDSNKPDPFTVSLNRTAHTVPFSEVCIQTTSALKSSYDHRLDSSPRQGEIGENISTRISSAIVKSCTKFDDQDDLQESNIDESATMERRRLCSLDDGAGQNKQNHTNTTENTDRSEEVQLFPLLYHSSEAENHCPKKLRDSIACDGVAEVQLFDDFEVSSSESDIISNHLNSPWNRPTEIEKRSIQSTTNPFVQNWDNIGSCGVVPDKNFLLEDFDALSSSTHSDFQKQDLIDSDDVTSKYTKGVSTYVYTGEIEPDKDFLDDNWDKDD